MKILIILGHPKPNSLNHAIAEACVSALKKQGHDIIFHDLYQEAFDPVLPVGEELLPEGELPDVIQNHLRNFKEAEGVIFIHPNWWGGPPAILRGWIDRVLRTDSCYNFTKDGVVSHVGGKIVQVFSTSNTPRDVEIKVFSDPIENFWKVIVFGLLGSKSFERRNFESVVLSTPEDRQGWLAEVESIIARRF
ncbi:MAG: NAD(P)H-dependent oxidoreductase [Planctomycetaceae bacterium]|nr:NAD(P)H-dependent oxidoreductase [Planctomycetaceae bacterium]